MRCIVLTGLMLLCAIPLFSFGVRDRNAVSQSAAAETVTRNARIAGIVRLVGSEPFTELIITGREVTEEHAAVNDRPLDWYISREDRAALHNLQQRTVVVEGDAAVSELRYANGMSAGLRYTLRNIRIISIE